MFSVGKKDVLIEFLEATARLEIGLLMNIPSTVGHLPDQSETRSLHCRHQRSDSDMLRSGIVLVTKVTNFCG